MHCNNNFDSVDNSHNNIFWVNLCGNGVLNWRLSGHIPVCKRRVIDLRGNNGCYNGYDDRSVGYADARFSLSVWWVDWLLPICGNRDRLHCDNDFDSVVYCNYSIYSAA